MTPSSARWPAEAFTWKREVIVACASRFKEAGGRRLTVQQQRCGEERGLFARFPQRQRRSRLMDDGVFLFPGGGFPAL